MFACQSVPTDEYEYGDAVMAEKTKDLPERGYQIHTEGIKESKTVSGVERFLILLNALRPGMAIVVEDNAENSHALKDIGL